jgi:hypothetical protein
VTLAVPSTVALLALLGACSSGPTVAPVTAPPPSNAAEATAAPQDPAKRAAELAVKVANGAATPAEKAELDAYIRGKK